MSNTNMFLCHYDMVIYWKALILSPPLRKRTENIWKSFIIRLAYEKRYRHPNRLLVRKVFLQSWWRILHSEWLNQSFCEIICINKKLRSTAVIDSQLLKVVGSLDLFWWNLHIIMLILAKDCWYQIIIWQCVHQWTWNLIWIFAPPRTFTLLIVEGWFWVSTPSLPLTIIIFFCNSIIIFWLTNQIITVVQLPYSTLTYTKEISSKLCVCGNKLATPAWWKLSAFGPTNSTNTHTAYLLCQ